MRIDLSLNENVYGIPSNMLQNYRLADYDISKYSNSNILTDYLVNNYELKRESIIMGYGIEDILLRIFHLLLDNKDVLLLADVAWEHYYALSNKVDAKCCTYTMRLDEKHYHFDIDEIIAKAKEYAPKVIIINSPNNPTGNGMTYSQLEYILANCPESIILFDECYMGFEGELSYSKQQSLVNAYDNVIFLNSLSKFFALASLRVGFAVTSPHIVEIYERIKPRWEISPMDLAISKEVLMNQDYFFESAKKIRKTREWFICKVRENTLLKIYDSESNFVYIKYKFACDLGEVLYARGYKVKYGEDYLRITIGRQVDMENIYDIIFEFDERHCND
ncbi:pyridoxal phosphate-dependent aminotransferase [Bacteroides acidifaciens]|uniref:pyridoxal phosphate-dependent aminotransferase n=1 Tax=Bacteroides acidifaciens TaxID=85831 RepID=UPI0025A94E6B|nr:histidinol-phosphate transaminase [Bacteroides acidifaciens]